MGVIRYTDTWGGKNYGCYPINTPGKRLKDSIDKSENWKILEEKNYCDKRNDNQIDIDRGSDYVYLNSDGKKIINIQYHQVQYLNQFS